MRIFKNYVTQQYIDEKEVSILVYEIPITMKYIIEKKCYVIFELV